jgi:sec-independent protein translocase protein TatB
MFEVGFGEIVLLFIVALLVLGPERLPEVIRTAALWLGRLKRGYHNIRTDIEREIGADDIRRQLHNEEVMASLKHTAEQVRQVSQELNTTATSSTTPVDDPDTHHAKH